MSQEPAERCNDEELVIRTRNGDEEAERELMQRYRTVVRSRTSAYYLEGGDPEDLMQEGMIGLFQAIRDFNESRGASFRTFAELCIGRQIVSAVRGAARMKHQPLNESVSLNNPAADIEEGGTLEEILTDGKESDPEKLILIREAVDFIMDNTEDVLTVLELNAWKMHLQGCSYREIAEELDHTSKSIDNAIQRAKKKLAEMISENK